MESNTALNSTISLKSIQELQYQSEEDKIKFLEHVNDFYKFQIDALEKAPFTNENERNLENLQNLKKSLECEIKEKKEKLQNINKRKELFKEKLFIPDDDRNDNFNIEHLHLAVPLYNDKEEKVTFSHFWQKLVCFAKNHKLSHFAIKNCLDYMLQANAFDVFSFIREKPFSECVVTLQNLFATVETIEDSLRKLATIKRQKSQKIQSFMAQISILLLKTQSLEKPEAQTFRYENEMKRFLLDSCTPEAREQLISHRNQSIKNGYKLSYSEMFSIVKDIESNQSSQKMSSTYYSFPNLRNRNKIPNSNLYRSKSSDSIATSVSKNSSASRMTQDSNKQKIVPKIKEAIFKHESNSGAHQFHSNDLGNNFKSRSNSRNSSISESGPSCTAKKPISSLLLSNFCKKHKWNHCYPFKCPDCIHDSKHEKCEIPLGDNLSLPLSIPEEPEINSKDSFFDQDGGYVSNHDELDLSSDIDLCQNNDLTPENDKEMFSNFTSWIEPGSQELTSKKSENSIPALTQKDAINLASKLNAKRLKKELPTTYISTLINTEDKETGLLFMKMNIPLQKYSIAVHAMIDTGSFTSLVTKRFLKSFDNFYLEFNECSKEVNGIGTRAIKISKTVKLPLAFYNDEGAIEMEFTHEFLVIEDTPIPFEIMIGLDFIHKHVIDIDYSKQKITLASDKTTEEKLHLEVNAKNRPWIKYPELIAIESKRINGDSEEIVTCRLSQNHVMVEDGDSFEISKHPDINVICMTKYLTHFPYQTLEVKLSNPCNGSVMIRPGAPIAQVTGVIDQITEDCSPMDSKPLHRVLNSMQVFGETMSYYEFAKLQNEDKECARIKLKATLPETYKVKSNVLIRMVDGKEKFALPKVLLVKLLNELHSNDSNNHGNKSGHIEMLHLDYYRPDMGKVVSQYHRNCAKCNQKEGGATPPPKSPSSHDSVNTQKLLDAENIHSKDHESTESPKAIDSNKVNNVDGDPVIKYTPKDPAEDAKYHPKQSWSIDLLTNLKPSKGYSSIYIFKDLSSEFRMLFPSKTSNPFEVVTHLKTIMKFFGKPSMIIVTKQILSSRDIVNFCSSKNIVLEEKLNCSVFENMDVQFRIMIENECSNDKEWIYLVNHMQDFMNYPCLRFQGQEFSPQTLQQGFHVDMEGIPSKIYSIDELFVYWKDYLQLQQGKYSKANNEHPSNGYTDKPRQFFRVGEPVFVKNNYFHPKTNTWKYRDEGPYQIIEIKRSQVALRDLQQPSNHLTYDVLNNLQKVKSANSKYGIDCSEFEWYLIQKNRIPVW